MRAPATLAALGVMAAAACVAQAATPQQVIEVLERQRAAHGIPAGLVEDPDLSRARALHNRYLRLNPSVPSHHAGFVGDEAPQPGQPKAFAATLREALDDGD